MPEPRPPQIPAGKRAADRFEPLRRLARQLPFGMASGHRLHQALDPELRAIARLRRQAPDGLRQPFPDTYEYRYPELFAALADRLRGIERPRVLSFGCSDGSELRSLQRYLPMVELVGIDLNPRALQRAQAHLAAHPAPSLHFRLAGNTADEPPESFDAILALAVLRHGELEAGRPADCGAILPFAQAASALGDLDVWLKPGGWLAVWHAHFRVDDASATAAYGAESLPFREKHCFTVPTTG